jgi:hypothetical protein
MECSGAGAVLGALSLILTGAFPASARPWNAADVAAYLQQRLELTPQQLRELKPIVETFARSVSEAIESRRGNGVEGWSTLADDLDSYHEELEAGLSKVLTSEQMAELEEIRVGVRSEVSSQLEERAFSGMVERLKLSENERERVLVVYQRDWRRKRELIETYRGERGREAARDIGRELRRIHEDTERDLESILTPKQLSDYRDYREEQRKKILENLKNRRRQK